tara:strand:- start:1424 stop:1966 length:543 start_codon:yes stop_codon:yes gene_type:complete
MKEKYKYVKNLFSKDLSDFLTSWSLKNMKDYKSTDPQVPSGAYSQYEGPRGYKNCFYHMLIFLQEKIEKETELTLKPMYTYNRLYLHGSDLKPHIDRAACEISVSISLNKSYKDKNYEWPLFMDGKPIVINECDGVIYKGHEVEHWRLPFTQPDGCWHHQLFLHYVDANGSHANLDGADI